MKTRIAFIAQPIDTIIRPGQSAPHSSLGIWVYEIAKRLSHDHDVSIYARRDGLSRPVLGNAGINCYGVAASLEDWLVRLFKVPERMLGYPNPERPFFASRWYYLGYIRQIARLLAADPPDIVHLMNFSQYVPLIRSACPQAKIVLHMQCQWLLEVDPVLISTTAADSGIE